MVTYVDDLDGITTDMLTDFFQNWPNRPGSATLLRILEGSDLVVLAKEPETSRIVGFITAITDGISCAYIPHLEVLPEWQGCGIGSELVTRMTGKLERFYMVDLICDRELSPFYERLGFTAFHGMIRRNYNRQNCE